VIWAVAVTGPTPGIVASRWRGVILFRRFLDTRHRPQHISFVCQLTYLRNMRNSSVLSALFPHVRQAVLAATLTQPDKWWHLSELARHLGISPSSLQREISSLVTSGLLLHRREGRKAYFKAETKSPVFRDLQLLFEKTSGLAPILDQMLKAFGD
jgi:DNA-binding HxlR family transcriptional regulator